MPAVFKGMQSGFIIHQIEDLAAVDLKEAC
jgi:hypothetical protein